MERRRRGAEAADVVALSGGRRYRVIRLGPDEIVVADDGAPPMRGIVDLVREGRRCGRLLVQLAWSEAGESGYEMKRRMHHLPSEGVPHGARMAQAVKAAGAGIAGGLAGRLGAVLTGRAPEAP
ncbi:MAG: hypothetical protein AAFR52_20320 [Pseudomonadota bacterium]